MITFFVNDLFIFARSGVFRHQFTAPGRYCYWSDYIDQYKTTWFRGCVTVVDQSSYVADVRVKVNGYEAVYQKTAPQGKHLANHWPQVTNL